MRFQSWNSIDDSKIVRLKRFQVTNFGVLARLAVTQKSSSTLTTAY
jgi:hypothetical protein